MNEKELNQLYEELIVMPSLKERFKESNFSLKDNTSVLSIIWNIIKCKELFSEINGEIDTSGFNELLRQNVEDIYISINERHFDWRFSVMEARRMIARYSDQYGEMMITVKKITDSKTTTRKKFKP